MGVTNYHEHVYVNLPPWASLVPGWNDHRIDDVEKIINELMLFEKVGGKTIVDASAIDFGHDPNKLKEIAQAMPNLHIIATTGFNKSAYCERWVYDWPVEKLVDFVCEHVTKGINGTNVKAGVVKAGTMYMRMQAIDIKLLKIAAETHKKTGVPISTHTEGGTMCLEQVEFFKSEGVDLSRVAIGHSDRNPDPDLHIQMCKQGVYLGYDCPGKIKYGPDNLRINLIKKVIEAGYGKRILLGNDLGRVSYLKSFGGGPGLDYVMSTFIPRLRSEGVSDTEINDILVENPKRFFSFL
jgi:phosphotriesterase-related protein